MTPSMTVRSPKRAFIRTKAPVWYQCCTQSAWIPHASRSVHRLGSSPASVLDIRPRHEGSSSGGGGAGPGASGHVLGESGRFQRKSRKASTAMVVLKTCTK